MIQKKMKFSARPMNASPKPAKPEDNENEEVFENLFGMADDTETVKSDSDADRSLTLSDKKSAKRRREKQTFRYKPSFSCVKQKTNAGRTIKKEKKTKIQGLQNEMTC